MTKPTITIRVRWEDYKAIRRVFKALKDESVISYFTRLANYLSERGFEDNGKMR